MRRMFLILLSVIALAANTRGDERLVVSPVSDEPMFAECRLTKANQMGEKVQDKIRAELKFASFQIVNEEENGVTRKQLVLGSAVLAIRPKALFTRTKGGIERLSGVRPLGDKFKPVVIIFNEPKSGDKWVELLAPGTVLVEVEREDARAIIAKRYPDKPPAPGQ